MNERQAHQISYESLSLFVGLLVIILGLMLFALLATSIVNNTGLVQFDQNVELAVHSWATPAVTPVALFFSLLGFQILWVVVGVVTIFLAVRRQWLHLTTWVIAWAGEELLNQLLKQIFARPRPELPNPLLNAANYSFPSGHAMSSAVMYGLLAFFILLGIRNRAGRIALIVATVALVLLIGASRIYLGVHYFSDVVAGYAVGSVWLSMCITAMDMVQRTRTARQTLPT